MMNLSLDGHLPTVEREEALRLIEKTVEAAASGTGSACSLTGGAGLGKTTLLRAAEQYAHNTGALVLRATATPLTSNRSAAVIRDLLDQFVSSRSTAARERLLSGATLPLRAVIDPDAPLSGDVPDPGALAYALFWFLARISDDRCFVVIIDDTHWADPLSCQALSYVIGRVAELRGSVIWAERPADSPSLAGHTPTHRLAPLTADAVERLLPDIGTDVVADIFERTGGNPLLVSLFARSGALDGGNDPPSIKLAADWAIAQSLAIGSDGPTVLRALSIVESASVMELSTVVELSQSAIRRVLEGAINSGLVARGTRARLVHPVVSDAMYGSMSHAQRDEFHWRAANLTPRVDDPPDKAAAHLLRCEPRGSASAVAILMAAAGRSRRVGDHAQWVTYLRRAVDEGAVERDRGLLLVELGRAELETATAGALEHLEAAMSLLDSPHAVVKARAVLATADVLAGRSVNAREGILSLLQPENIAMAVESEPELPWAAWTSFRFAPGSADVARQVQDLLMADDSPRSARRTGFGLAALDRYLRGDTRQAVESALATAASLGSDVRRYVEHSVFAQIGIGDYAGADRTIVRSLAALTSRWSPIDRARMLSDAMWLDTRRGRPRSAVATADELLTLMPVEWAPQRALTQANLVAPLFDIGEAPAARDVVASLRSADHNSDTLASAWFHFALAVESGARNSHLESLAASLRCRDLLRSMDASAVSFVEWWRQAVPAARASGQHDLAEELDRQLVADAYASGHRRTLAIALHVGAFGPEALDRLEHAVEVIDGTDHGLEEARIRLAFGVELRRRRFIASAREQLRTALDLAIRHGSSATEEAAFSELLASGARPRRPRTSGLESLTPRELQVLRAIGDGRSNSDIAEMMFISRRTVETHVSSILRKLSAESRAEARLFATQI